MLVLAMYAEMDHFKNEEGIDPRALLYLRLPDGRDIEITLLEAENGKGRVGVVAPPDVKVERYLYRKNREPNA